MTGDPKDTFGVTIEPAARRLANIKTVAALNLPISKEIEALGKITYDETSEATISAYVDGRVVDLFIDYTGAKVTKGQELAMLYSPDLYSDQVGLLNAKEALEKRGSQISPASATPTNGCTKTPVNGSLSSACPRVILSR